MCLLAIKSSIVNCTSSTIKGCFNGRLSQYSGDVWYKSFSRARRFGACNRIYQCNSQWARTRAKCCLSHPPNNVINGINLAKLNFLKSWAAPMCGLSPSLTAVSLVSLSFHVSTNEIDNALTQFDQKRKCFQPAHISPWEHLIASHMYAALDSLSRPVTSWHEYIYTQKALTDCLTFTFALAFRVGARGVNIHWQKI